MPNNTAIYKMFETGWHMSGYRTLNGLTHWLGDMQVGNATPFSMVLPLNSLLTALHTNSKFLTASVHNHS